MNAPRRADALTFIKKATPARVFNAALLWVSYYVSRLLKLPLHWGLPMSISVEPTTSCNLRCPQCPSGVRFFTRPTGMLQPDVFEGVINQLHKQLWYLTLYFQGEPYLNPNFLSYVAYAHKKGIYTATSTNGHYLNPQQAEETVNSGLSRLIISIDGTTQDTYSQYRVGGQLSKVIEGTKNLVEAKRRLGSQTPHIIFQYIVFKPNSHQIGDAKALADELGVDEIRFKTAQVYDYQTSDTLIPTDGDFARYHRNPDGTYTLKNQLLNHCWRMWQGCVITWDGAVVPCCFDKDASHQLGHTNQTPFAQIWKSVAYQQFRASILKTRKEIDICQNCTEGTKVWVAS